MHRTIQLNVAPESTERLLKELQDLDDVVSLSVQPGASLKPVGDVVTVHTLNRGTDDVLKAADAARGYGDVSVATAELSAIIDPNHESAVDDDVDEAVWEEMETGLRHQGRVTPNFLTLMALGGGVATVGLVSAPVPQAIALVAASVIAPGFEPVAKLPLGLVLRRTKVLKRGALSMLAGYGALVAAAAVTFLVLRGFGGTTTEALVTSSEAHRIAHQQLGDLMTSALAATAGVVMVAAYRRSVIAGPLIALFLVPSAALSGSALAAGELRLALQGVERLVTDIAVVVVLGAAVFAVKQARVHRRAPMV